VTRRPAAARRLAAFAAAVVTLAGCSPTTSTKEQVAIHPHASQTAATDPSSASAARPVKPPKGFEPYYQQRVTWQHCDMTFECATVTAPTDWSDPSSAPIKLALERHAATGNRIGSLLVNPGGPGASGTDFVGYAPYLFGKDVLAAYDVVGFDPRGVGRSSAVTCLSDADWDRFTAASFPSTTPAGRDAVEAAYESLGAACASGTGDLLDHVDTVSAARDLDMVRAVLGEDKLDYLGFSYGTQLGSTYAALFPGHVGRMVLDGAIDPTLTPEQEVTGQAAGFEQAARSYVADCQGGSDCPLSGSVDDGVAQIGRLLDGLLARPMPTGDVSRPLTQSLGLFGIIYPLYAQSLWPTLTSALDDAINRGDGSGLLANADSYNSRDSDGTYADNSGVAFIAISCQDSRESSDPADMAAQAAELDKVAPTFGRFLAYGGLTCEHWPAPVVPLEADVAAPGAPPIVVVGTTGDPATPYSWAQGLATVLDSGVLVTYDGEGHTAYGSSNDCVLEAVDDYLVDGVVPADGTLC